MTFYRRELRLIGYLFEEISKQTINFLLIIFQPILTCLVAVLASYYIKSLLLTTESNKSIYLQILSLIFYSWFIIFIHGCQNFMIAGTVSKFHQEQDTTNQKSFFWQTFFHLIHFHLGSVCCGRFITIFKPVTIVSIVNSFVAIHRNLLIVLEISKVIEYLMNQRAKLFLAIIVIMIIADLVLVLDSA